MPLSTFYTCRRRRAREIALRIHTHVREDQLALFGFATPLELAMFERLIAVSGIGPKLALAVLSGIEPRELVGAIQRNDLARLTRDSRRRQEDRRAHRASSCAIGCRRRSTRPARRPSPADALRDDLVSALANLGYHRQAIDKALDKLLAGTGRRAIRRRAAGGAEGSRHAHDRSADL